LTSKHNSHFFSRTLGLGIAVAAAFSIFSPVQTVHAEKVGDHFEIDLPGLLKDEPRTRVVMNFPQHGSPAQGEMELHAPPGFEISVFAEGGFREPRNVVVAPNGDFFLADSAANTVFVLRDTNGDGKADFRSVFIEGIKRQPFGIAFYPGYVYIGTTGNVVRFAYEPGQTEAKGEPETVIERLPTGGTNNHWTRNLLFNSDQSKLYVSVGSSSNLAEEEPHRATILECNPDGSALRIFASGLRNPVALDWNPTTGELWTSVNERDLLGDDIVPDYVTSVKEGGFYGWPYFYLGPNADFRMKGKGMGLRDSVIVPDVLIQAHSASLGAKFYAGDMFPEEYRGDLFVAFHGSWNRSLRTGYKIVRVRFDDAGMPVGGYENFLVGWLPDPKSPKVWGRPVMVSFAPDGAMLIADDSAKKIWRVSYSGE